MEPYTLSAVAAAAQHLDILGTTASATGPWNYVIELQVFLRVTSSAAPPIALEHERPRVRGDGRREDDGRAVPAR